MTAVDTSPKDGSLSAPLVASQTASSERPRVRARDPYFDNAKFLLVVLVVIGHNWYPLIGHSRAVKAAYLALYTFHIPAFILLSGYFSGSFEARPEQVRKLIKTVLLPYLIFESFYLAVVAYTDGHKLNFDLTYPSYLCWFLIALFVWRLTAPVWRAMPQPLLISVLVSVIAGLMNVSTDLALSRVLQFLPWFVAGLAMRPAHFQRLRRPVVRIGATAALLVSLPVAYLLAPWANADWLSMEWGADELKVGRWEYVAIRITLFAAGAVLVAAALAVMPGRKLWFTALGTMTMYPYLLHGLIVKIAQGNGLYGRVADIGPPAFLGLTVGAVALAVALTTPPVRKVTRWAVEPSFPRPRG